MATPTTSSQHQSSHSPVTAPRWQRIALGVAIIFPIALLADFGLFHLKHRSLIWSHGGRWCADVDDVSGEVLDFHYGNAACDEGKELVEQM